MTNLSGVSSITKKIVDGVAIALAALILLFIAFQIGSVVKDIVAPTPAAAPNTRFGKLTQQSFPQNTNLQTYTYTLNTLSGQLPTLPDRITVYKLQQPNPSLLGLDKAKTIASGEDFTDAPTAISDVLYKWTKQDPFPTSLTMDIQSFDFFLTSSYRTDPIVLDALHVPDETTAQTVTKEFFDKLIPLPTYIDESKTKTTLFAISLSGLSPASSLSTAQIIRLDYFPKTVDSLPIYTANPTQSLIYALVGSGTTDFPQVVEAQYYHKGTTSEKATYPIKTASQAYDELKQGKGYIAANPTTNTNVTITNVSLGYYIDASAQQYLWPIIVFQGDKGFYAYVSAVTNQWIK